MRENGILNKWIAFYLNKWDHEKDENQEQGEILGFSRAKLCHFKGLFVIWAFMIVLLIVKFAFEICDIYKIK